MTAIAIFRAAVSLPRSLTRVAITLFAMTLFSMTLATQTVHAAEAPLFAAPAVTPATGAEGGSSLSQVTLALVVVLALVFIAAWGLRYLRKLNFSGNAQQLQIVAQVALGAKERAVLIRVNDMQVLVGVAPGRVTALHTFTSPPQMATQNADGGPSAASAVQAAAPQVAAMPPSFQTLLKRSLGLS